ncbi:MAG TPA: energy transducer TonB, partial [Chitinophagaceae bacterium]|nr:energy transducer TonB [Chitinophagaceae bacterium]
ILEHNHAPSLVLECGSITNATDLAFISNEANQEQVAKTILAAITAWANTDRKAKPAPLPETVRAFTDTPRVKPFVNVHANRIIVRADKNNEEYPDATTNVSVLPDRLLIINGKKYTPKEAVQFKGATIKADEMVVMPAGDKKAIELYGQEAANGVIEFKDAKIIPPTVVQPIQQIEINGIKTFTGNPLVIIDGDVRISADSIRFHLTDPNDIESITVLKGESATALYGEEAKNGAILITTKKAMKEVTVVGKKTDRTGKDNEPTEALKEVVVTGKPLVKETQPVLEEVTVVGKHSGEIVKNTQPKLDEVVVTGYAKPKSNNPSKVDEVVVTGYAKPKSNTQSKLDEVVVTGYAKPKSNNPSKVDEVVVTGYAKPKSNTASKVDEVEVVGYRVNNDNKIFEKVEVEASFPGGESAFRKYLEDHLEATVAEQNGAPKGVYTIFVRFIVDVDGTISDVRPLTNHGFGMEQEAVRLIKQGPKWIPAMQNGHKVKSYRKQPINFASNNKPVTSAPAQQLPEVVFVGYASSNSSNMLVSSKKLDQTTPGSSEWRKFFERNVNINVFMSETATKVKRATIMVKFAVEPDGSILNIQELTKLAPHTTLHIVTMFRANIRKAINNDNERKWYVQPLTFIVEDDKASITDNNSKTSIAFSSKTMERLRLPGIKANE